MRRARKVNSDGCLVDFDVSDSRIDCEESTVNGRRGLCMGCGRMERVVWHTTTCENLCANCAACPGEEKESEQDAREYLKD